MKRYDAFLGLGSNRGDRKAYLTKAVQELLALEESRIICVSPVYETEPYGKKDQPAFLNAALQIETTHPPEGLFPGIKTIEVRLGRVEGERWGPREIDIDILMYDGLVCNTGDVTVPHPDLGNRNFVLIPLMDIAPDLVHPINGMTVTEMTKNCKSGGRIVRSHHSIRY